MNEYLLQQLNLNEIRGLSLTQPWASLIAIGVKKIETRSWRTHYRGPLAIHASKGFRWPEDWELVPFPAPDALPRGAILAVATLRTVQWTGHNAVYPPDWLRTVDDIERAFGDFSEKRYGWFLEDVHELAEPIPCRGARGLWTVPPAIVAEIQRQVVA